jgi:hypothetical protein
MNTVYVRYNHDRTEHDLTSWLEDNIGPEGNRYYSEPASMQNVDIGVGFPVPVRHFAVTFDYDDDATLFRMRWL